MKLFKCPSCGKPNTKWRFYYSAVTLEGVWSYEQNNVVVHPPLIVRNSITPEDALRAGNAIVVCPKCDAEATFSQLEFISICDIQRTPANTVEQIVTIPYRIYGLSEPVYVSIVIDVDTSINGETLRELLSVD